MLQRDTTGYLLNVKFSQQWKVLNADEDEEQLEHIPFY